jgi:RNA-binding protein 39
MGGGGYGSGGGGGGGAGGGSWEEGDAMAAAFGAGGMAVPAGGGGGMAGVVAAAAAGTAAAAAGPTPGAVDYPSAAMTLKNMFDPSQMAGENWWMEIGEDVRDECSRHGEVLHMHVDVRSQGFVYVKFDTAAAAASARQTLNMRWFAGRLITCDFTPVEQYDNQFQL